MGAAKDVMTANGDDTMDTGDGPEGTGLRTGDGSPYVLMETRPQTGADSAGASGGTDRSDDDANHSDSALQVEEPGYGYGV